MGHHYLYERSPALSPVQRQPPGLSHSSLFRSRPQLMQRVATQASRLLAWLSAWLDRIDRSRIDKIQDGVLFRASSKYLYLAFMAFHFFWGVGCLLWFLRYNHTETIRGIRGALFLTLGTTTAYMFRSRAIYTALEAVKHPDATTLMVKIQALITINQGWMFRTVLWFVMLICVLTTIMQRPDPEVFASLSFAVFGTVTSGYTSIMSVLFVERRERLEYRQALERRGDMG